MMGNTRIFTFNDLNPCTCVKDVEYNNLKEAMQPLTLTVQFV